MKNNLVAQIVYRSVYCAVAILALVIAVGFWSIGPGAPGETVNWFANFKPFFFLDYIIWALIMSLVATVPALCENFASLRAGKTHAFSEKFPLLKFCTMSTMLFVLILSVFFLDRVGNHHLTDSAETQTFFPGIATAGFWLDLSVFLPRFVLPIAYMVMYLLFEPRMKTRGIYGTIGILPPTIFYFFDLFFGMIMSAAYGGADNLKAANGVFGNMFANVYPFFFQDSTGWYKDWWWILIWPTIFGVSLVLINNFVFRLTRITRGADGKLHTDKKTKPNEDELHDIIHIIKVRRAAKKAEKAALSGDSANAEASSEADKNEPSDKE